MTRIGDECLTRGDSFESPKATALHLLALDLYKMSLERPHSVTELEAWKRQVNDTHAAMRALCHKQRREEMPAVPHAQRGAAKAHFDRRLAGFGAAHREVMQQLNDIAKLPDSDRRSQLDCLWRNWVLPRIELHGEVTGKDLTAPNWQAARGLMTASSEPTVLQLETAFERGRFERVTTSDYPMADVSGTVGKQHVSAFVELTPLPTEAGPDAKALMHQLAERMRDPLEALGPKTAQAMQWLLAAWLARRNADGWLVAHISQIAEGLGYSRRATGDYDADTYTAIRGYIDQLRRATIRGSNLPALKGKASRTQFEEPAFTFALLAANEDIDHIKGRPAQHWVSLRFRPNTLYTAAADRDGAFLMGADTAINRLDTQHQRTTLLLGKYLERYFRINWNSEPGVLTRRVQELLTKGMGMTAEAADRPSIDTMRRLADDLDELEELGTLRHWQGDDVWATVRDALEDAANRKRMTPRLWAQVLEARVTIEAGGQYHEQYKHHGLTHQSDIDPLILELRQYLSTPNARPQKRIAADLGISDGQLSMLIRGRRKPTEQIRQKLDAMLVSERTLPLPFD